MPTTNATNVIPQYFELLEVGKTIKSTKKQYIWRFSLKRKDYTVEIFTSVLSGKKKILQNGATMFDEKKFLSFQFSRTLEGNALSIVQQKDNFELMINNESFTSLLDKEKNEWNIII